MRLFRRLWPDPQGYVRRLYGLVDDPQQPLLQFGETDLLAKGGVEGGERSLRVVPGAIEAAIDGFLDAGANGLEEADDQQCRGDEREGRVLPSDRAHERLQADDAANKDGS